MIFWLVVIAGTALAVLVSLKGWAWVTSRAKAAPSKIEAELAERGINRRDFETAWSDVEDYVRDADKYWPLIKQNWILFSLGCATSVVLTFFAVAGAWTLAGGSILFGLLMCSVFGFVNIAQAGICISGDRGSSDWHTLDKSDRSATSWALLTILLIINFVGGFVGSAVVGSTMATQNQIVTESLNDAIKERERTAAAIAAINERRMAAGGLSAEALETKAQATAEAAQRESTRKYCGTKCEALKAEAAKWKALAADAKRERELTDRLREINDDLATRGYASTETSPAGKTFEEITMGAISEETFSKRFVLFFQWIIAVGDFLIWLKVGDIIGRARREEHFRRAERGNEILQARGLKPRYALPKRSDVDAEPSDAPKVGDTIVLSMDADPDAVIASSRELSEVQKLLNETVAPSEQDRVSFGTLYSVYVARSKASGRKTWLNNQVFFSSLKTVCELKKKQHAGSHLVGYRLTSAELAAPTEGEA